MLLTSYHPGPAPREPTYPGKRAHPTLKAWYYLQRWRWRNHYRKQSPWWDWYTKYLKSRAWKKVSKAALIRDGHRCQMPGCRQKAVQVHHKHYRYVGREWEQMSCVVSVCVRCHDREHGKLGFWHWLWKHLQPGNRFPGQKTARSQ